jgi:hypothetical protein
LTTDPSAVGNTPATYAGAIHAVFVAVVPVSLVAFVLTWFLKEVLLRTTSTQVDAGQTLGMPPTRSSADTGAAEGIATADI